MNNDAKTVVKKQIILRAYCLVYLIAIAKLLWSYSNTTEKSAAIWKKLLL